MNRQPVTPAQKLNQVKLADAAAPAGSAISTRVASLLPAVLVNYDARRDCWVLLGPDCVLALDPVAHAVIARLNGRRTVGQIVTAMGRVYDAAPDVISADVDDLLTDLSRRHLVRLDG